MIVRGANRGDRLPVLALLLEMHKTSALDWPLLSLSRITSAFDECLASGFVAVAESDGGVVGSIGARLAQHWFSDEPFIGDVWFYVTPSARKSSAARRLLRALQEYATTKGMPLLTADVSGEEVERKHKFYTRSGLHCIGGVYTQGL